MVHAQARRLASAAARAPLVALGLAAAWLTAPVVAFRASEAVTGALEAVVADPASARAVVWGLALPAAAAGAALALTAPSVLALGPQLAAAPVTPRSAAAALIGPAAATAGILVAPTVVALVIPLANASPGGRGAALSLLCHLCAVAAAGAVVAEAVLGAARGRPRSAFVVPPAVAVSLVASASLVSRSLSETGLWVPAVEILLGGSTVALCMWGWIALAALRPPARPRASRRALVPVPRRPVLGAGRAALALLARRSELRLALGAATCFGAVGIALAWAADAGVEAGLLLGGGSCLLAASLAPLTAGGRLDGARWTWRAGNAAQNSVAFAGASVWLMACALVPVVVLGVGLGASMGIALQVVALGLLGWGSALVAGSLVPRRASGALDDAAALVAFAVCATALGAIASFVEPRLDGAGVPGSVALLVTLAGIGTLGVGSLAAAAGTRR